VGHTAAAGAGHGTGADVGHGHGHGSGIGQGGTSFFKVPARGRRIVYVIDRSSSMGRHGALNIARQELVASLHALPADASFQIIVYNSTAQPLIEEHPGWLAATADNKLRVARDLAALEATHGTKHDRALPMALALQPDVIFFLTDADDLDPRQLATLTARNQGRAAIHVIELNTNNVGRTDAPLQVFARQNRGTYHAVDLSRYP
jgi:hypothetical protein